MREKSYGARLSGADGAPLVSLPLVKWYTWTRRTCTPGAERNDSHAGRLHVAGGEVVADMGNRSQWQEVATPNACAALCCSTDGCTQWVWNAFANASSLVQGGSSGPNGTNGPPCVLFSPTGSASTVAIPTSAVDPAGADPDAWPAAAGVVSGTVSVTFGGDTACASGHALPLTSGDAGRHGERSRLRLRLSTQVVGADGDSGTPRLYHFGLYQCIEGWLHFLSSKRD